MRTDGSVALSFLIAKSRVAPLKSITLPRLELLAALIGGRFFWLALGNPSKFGFGDLLWVE